MRVTKLSAEFSEKYGAFLVTVCASSEGRTNTRHTVAELIPGSVYGWCDLDDVQRAVNKALMLLRSIEDPQAMKPRDATP